MKISHIMEKRFPKLSPDETIANAIKEIVCVPESSLPVVSKDGKYLGELSQKKLLLLDIGEALFSEDNFNFSQINDLQAKDAKIVSDLMDTHAFTLTPNDEVMMAIKILYKEEIASIPVVVGDNIVGLVTDISVLKHYKDIQKGKL